MALTVRCGHSQRDVWQQWGIRDSKRYNAFNCPGLRSLPLLNDATPLKRGLQHQLDCDVALPYDCGGSVLLYNFELCHITETTGYTFFNIWIKTENGRWSRFDRESHRNKCTEKFWWIMRLTALIFAMPWQSFCKSPTLSLIPPQKKKFVI